MIIKITRACALSFAAAMLIVPVHSRADEKVHRPPPAQFAQADDPNMGTAEGEVRKIDKSAQKITIRHGHISGLDMDAMTMVFRVKEPAMLDAMSVGDKVKFTVRRAGGAMVLESVEPMK